MVVGIELLTTEPSLHPQLNFYHSILQNDGFIIACSSTYNIV